MDLNLVKDDQSEKLSYYTKGSRTINGEHFSLLGFKDDFPVLTPCLDPSILKGQIKIIRKLPSSVNLSKLQIDDTGDKFINVNGQKLKLVPQGRIPEEVRKRTNTMFLKQKIVNTGTDNSKIPLQVRIISNTMPINKASTFQLVKSQSADIPTTNIDKPIVINGTKKYKLITKLQNPTSSTEVIHTETSVLSTVSVNPTKKLEQRQRQGNNSAPCLNLGIGELMPIANTRGKLLCEKTLNILNLVKQQAKMQALNLSKKKIENIMEEIEKPVCSEIGIQTDECKTDIKKKFTDQTVQTDIQRSCQKNFDMLDFDMFDLDSLLDGKLGPLGESPVINDVNLGTGPSMGKIMKAEDTALGFPLSVGEPNALDSSISGKHMNNTMKKQLLFFKDLRECLTHNASGNLPIHEGVIENDVGLVKRNCTALKARKSGVNLENHNGCTPLQLAIINDAHVDIVQTLLDYEADIRDADGEGNSILHLAAKFARHKILEVILFHKTFSFCFDCINSFNFEGLTPLMICCISSWAAGAHLFVNHGANVNLKDQTSGRTALFHASEAQNVEIVRLLLNSKADPKIKNFFGTSPHDAMYELEEMPDMIKSLIFGRSKKRSIEAEMNPIRTAKAAKSLKTFSVLQKIEYDKEGAPIVRSPVRRYKMQRQVK